jgi:hypothetical protein
MASQMNSRRCPVKTSSAGAAGRGSQGRRRSADSHNTARRRGAGRRTNASATAPAEATPSHQNEGSTPMRGAPAAMAATASVPHETQSPTLLHRNALSVEGDSRLAVIRRACYHRTPAACIAHICPSGAWLGFSCVRSWSRIAAARRPLPLPRRRRSAVRLIRPFSRQAVRQSRSPTRLRR